MLQQARAPRSGHEAASVAAIGLLVALPLVRFALEPTVSATEVATGSLLLAHAALLAIGSALHLERRLGGDRGDGWLVAVLVAVGLQGVYWAALATTGVVAPAEHPALAASGQVVGLLLVLLVVRLGERVPGTATPLITGVVAGLGIIAARSAITTLVPDREPDSSSPWVVAALLGIAVGLALALAVALLRVATVHAWVRVRLAGAVVLVVLGRLAVLPVQESWPAVVACVCTALAAAVLLATTIELVGEVLRTEREVMGLLRRRLADVEAEIRTDRSRVHEIRATLGGIAVAADLLHRRAGAIGPARRAEIETMMDSELARLERLTDDVAAAPGWIELDATLLPLVLRHRLRGHVVHWEPSGRTAWGRADDIAEVVSVLLENARQHAPGAEVRIQVVERGRDVEVLVSDRGPGVDPVLGAAVFDWGGRRAGSRGEGIGLSAASEIATALGGSLRLADSPTGATFALGLPTTPVRHGTGASA